MPRFDEMAGKVAAEWATSGKSLAQCVAQSLRTLHAEREEEVEGLKKKGEELCNQLGPVMSENQRLKAEIGSLPFCPDKARKIFTALGPCSHRERAQKAEKERDTLAAEGVAMREALKKASYEPCRGDVECEAIPHCPSCFAAYTLKYSTPATARWAEAFDALVREHEGGTSLIKRGMIGQSEWVKSHHTAASALAALKMGER